jgi:DNA-binding transcriptional regulator YhcF (GntR family)
VTAAILPTGVGTHPDLPDDFNPWLVNDFCKLPRATLRCAELTSAAKVMLAALLDFAKADGKCFPKVSTLALNIGVTVRTARRHVAELEAKGFVRRVEQFSSNGSQTSNTFKFTRHSVFSTDDQVSSVAKSRGKTVAIDSVRADSSVRGGRTHPSPRLTRGLHEIEKPEQQCPFGKAA